MQCLEDEQCRLRLSKDMGKLTVPARGRGTNCSRRSNLGAHSGGMGRSMGVVGGYCCWGVEGPGVPVLEAESLAVIAAAAMAGGEVTAAHSMAARLNAACIWISNTL